MKKLLVAVFDTNNDAFNSSVAINQLHKDGDVTVFGSVVLEKDQQGEVLLKQSRDNSGESWALGFLGGSLLGAFTGPAGLAIGASIGSLTGLCFDANRAGVDIGFIDEVSAAIEPGMTALVLDIEENWITPIDSCVDENKGIVFRRNRSEVVEDQLERESKAIAEEYTELKNEMAGASEDAKISIQKHLDSLSKKSEEMQRLVNKRMGDIQDETSLKSKALTNQLENATNKGKEKIEKRLEALQRGMEKDKHQLQSCLETLVS